MFIRFPTLFLSVFLVAIAYGIIILLGAYVNTIPTR